MSYEKWENLIGLKVVAFRGYKIYGSLTLRYILFDDQKTWLELTEQDPYEYHDCCSSARMLELRSDELMWKSLFDKEGIYEEITNLGRNPF